MSDQTKELTPENVAYFFVEYCEQNTIKVNESKFGSYVECIEQPLILDKIKEELKNIIFAQAVNFTKNKLENDRISL